MKPSLDRIVTITLAIQLLNQGEPFRKIASAAKMNESTLRYWVRGAGFRKSCSTGKYRIP